MNSSINFQLCSTEFWNQDLTWNSAIPQLTECFRDTVLAWVPACLLLYVCTYEYLVLGPLKSQKKESIPRNWFNRLRISVAFLLFLVKLCAVASYLDISLKRQDQPPPKEAETGVLVNHGSDNVLFVSSLLAPAIQSISFLLLAIIYHLQRVAGRHTSGPVWFYLLATLLCSIVNLYSDFVSSQTSLQNKFEQTLDYIYYGLVLVIFLLECRSDRPVIEPHTINASKPVSPELEASFLSQLIFWWFNPFLLFGYRHELTTSSLWRLTDRDRSVLLVPKFRHAWSNPPKGKKSAEENVYRLVDGEVQQFNSIIRVFFKLYWPRFILTMVLKFMSDVLQFSTPMVLKKLLEFMTDKDAPQWHGLLFAFIHLAMPSVQSIILGNYFYQLQLMGLNIKCMIVGNLYRKALALSAGSRMQSTTGEIVNLMAVDSQRFQDVLMYCHLIWSAPLQITLAITLLYRELGWCIIAGVCFLVLIIPCVAFLATRNKEAQTKLIKTKDHRIKQTNEVLSGIKVIKLYAWENSFMANLLGFRSQEIKYLKRILTLNATQNFLWSCSPFVVAVISFGLYISVDKANVLDAQKAFVSISLFNLLSFPLLIVSTLVQTLVLTSVAARRLNNFLNNDEMVDYVTRNDELEAISIESGTCNWVENDSEKFEKGATLEDINLHVMPGSFVAVVGQVASGKSSLLASILGEMYRVAGRFNICKSMQLAYVPQQAWIQNMTVRDNILFGSPFEADRYQQVLSKCSLEADLEMLTAGDQSEIGEKGINLSGGQKQRVSLARACYSNADIFLLDDPLSALDSHVAKQVFEEVLSSTTGLLGNKTRVLATNSLFLLPHVDQIVVMEKGRIVEKGTYKELMSIEGGHLAEVMRQYLGKLESEEEKQEEPAADNQPSSSELVEAVSKKPTQLSKFTEGKLIELEKIETGSVNFKVYLQYFKAVSIFWLVCTLMACSSSSVFNVSTNFWLSNWSSDSHDPRKSQDPDLRKLRLTVYAGLGAFQCIAILLGTYSLARGAVRASKHLHHTLLDRIMHSPMSFFDVTPNGRIVNRFAKDIDVLDSNLPDNFRSWLNCSLQVSSTVFVICYSFPTFIAVVIPLGVIYFLIQRVFIVTTRQLKRLESNTRSPIFSHFGETLSGMSVIRAYDCVDRFVSNSYELVDRNQSCSYPNIIANRWLSLRLEFFGNLITSCAALFSVYYKGQVDAGVAGLVVSYSMNITQILNWFVRMNSDLETNIVSVERIMEYMNNKQEDQWIKDKRPPSDWPARGEVIIENYSTRYRSEMGLVLTDLSISIKPREKIGVVGRTGSGKSSLSLSLFRILEPAAGRIYIDELDVLDYGLHDLRSKLTIIPQDPVLFSGTLRFNLDPLKLYSDLDIWRSLELAHLRNYVNSLKAGLDYQVSEYGENFSMGQRQLICLARAILRQSRILILDEATASVDLETDNIVQRVIREVFVDSTIITIAHRLHTILDSDRILVLDRGQVVELDSPRKLLSNPNSVFSSLARDAGIDLGNILSPT